MLTEDQKRRLAIYGTLSDIYRVEARFTHSDGPVIYETNGDEMDGSEPNAKGDAYRQVADWLMSENIQQVLVYKNGTPHQRIAVHEGVELDEIQPNAAIDYWPDHRSLQQRLLGETEEDTDDR